VGSEDSTVVVEFPIDSGEGVRTLDEVSMWEQLGLAAFLQRYWADNQVKLPNDYSANFILIWLQCLMNATKVSCTVTFDPSSEGPQLSHALDLFQFQLKGVSFLPREKQAPGAVSPYAQMPYESISEASFSSRIKTLDFQKLSASLPGSTLINEMSTVVDEVPDKFCDTAACSLDSI
jgi:ribonucleoside-triphosphate reductase